MIDDLTTEKISERFFYSKETSYTIKHYLDRRRLSRSVELLENHNFTILEVALMCGINSHEVFTRKFKKEFGITPSEYRKSDIHLDTFKRLDVYAV